jgi:hypothetical protein
LDERNKLIQERIKRNAALDVSERTDNPWVLYANQLMRKSEVRKRNNRNKDD